MLSFTDEFFLIGAYKDIHFFTTNAHRGYYFFETQITSIWDIANKFLLSTANQH